MTAPIPDEAVEAAMRDLREVATACTCGSDDGDKGTCTCPSVFVRATDGSDVVEVYGLVDDLARVALAAAAPILREQWGAEATSRVRLDIWQPEAAELARHRDAITRLRQLLRMRMTEAEGGGFTDADTLWPSEIYAALDGVGEAVVSTELCGDPYPESGRSACARERSHEMHSNGRGDAWVREGAVSAEHRLQWEEETAARIRAELGASGEAAARIVEGEPDDGPLEDACAHCPGTCTHLGCGADGVRRRVLEEVDGVLRDQGRHIDYAASHPEDFTTQAERNQAADYLRDVLGGQGADRG